MNTSQNTSSTSALWAALGLSPAAQPYVPSEMDRGSRFETLSYDGSTDSEMPPLEPVFKTPPPLKRCDAIKPPEWPAPPKFEMRYHGCSAHEGLYDEGGNRMLGRSVCIGGIEPECLCDVKRALWGGGEEPLVVEPPVEVEESKLWSPKQLDELKQTWNDKLLATRDEQHAHDIEHLVNYIYDNNAWTLFEDLKRVMETAKSARDLTVDIYWYQHASVNSPQDKSRWEPYEAADGEVFATLQQFLHHQGYETQVPGGSDDVHWLVKKTSFLKRLAARFGAANFTASYKLKANEIDGGSDFFVSDATLRLHFWPNGVPFNRFDRR